jgi:hypothetical protein
MADLNQFVAKRFDVVPDPAKKRCAFFGAGNAKTSETVQMSS